MKTKMSDSKEDCDFSGEIETNNYNKNNVQCKFCDSKILNPMSAIYATHEVSLLYRNYKY